MKGEQLLAVFCSKANQRVVEMAYFRLPPTQGIGMRRDFVRVFYKLLNTFDVFLQIVIFEMVFYI